MFETRKPIDKKDPYVAYVRSSIARGEWDFRKGNFITLEELREHLDALYESNFIQ